MIDAALFDSGRPVVLQFSGGKDSLACWVLLKPWRHLLTLMWVNSGDAFPEVEELARNIGSQCREYLEVKGNQPAAIRTHGWPVDFVPVWHTSYGRQLRAGIGPVYQPTTSCCAQSLWEPAATTIAAMAPCTVIRGQRDSERYKGLARSGLVEGGVTYLFPLESWSEERVLETLAEAGIELPESYRYFNSSPDCQHCTAYLEENRGRYSWIAKKHPNLVPELRYRLAKIRETAELSLAQSFRAEQELTHGL